MCISVAMMNLKRGRYIVEAMIKYCKNGDAFISENWLFKQCQRTKPDLSFAVFHAVYRSCIA